MPAVTVQLDMSEHEALQKLAYRERRNLKGQAAVVIRRALESAGLLVAGDTTPPSVEREAMEAEAMGSAS